MAVNSETSQLQIDSKCDCPFLKNRPTMSSGRCVRVFLLEAWTHSLPAYITGGYGQKSQEPQVFQLQPFLEQKALIMVTHILATSWTDYCNWLYMRIHWRVTCNLHLMQIVVVYMTSLSPCSIAAAGPLSFWVLLKLVSISTILYYLGIFEIAFPGRNLPALSMQIDSLQGNPSGGHKSKYLSLLVGQFAIRVNSSPFPYDLLRHC